MSALQKILDATAAALIEAEAFPSDEPDCELIDKIIEAQPTMMTVHSFRTSSFFTYLNSQTRDFYGLEEKNASHLNSFFFVRTFHPRTLHLLAHTYQFFYRKHQESLKLSYRLKNSQGEYENVSGISKGVHWNEKGRLAFILSATCREKDLPLLNAIVNLGLQDLGERQKEALGWLLKGHTNAQIGDEMGISARTVEKHVYAIYKEAGITSRAEILQHSS